MVIWVVAGVGLLLGFMALAACRRLSRKLDALNQSYWELRYDYTRLRSQVARIDPEQAEAIAPEPHTPAPTVSFVPLSSIKKRDG